MIRRRKVLAVASFEFLSTVKRKGYLIATLGMPIFMVLYIGVVGLIGGTAIHKKENETRVYGVVDPPGALRLSGDAAVPAPELPPAAKAALEATGRQEQVERALAQGNAVFRPYASEDEARAALDAGAIKGYYLIAEDYLESGRVDSYLREGNPIEMKGADGQLGRLIVQRLLVGRVPDDISERVRQPIKEGKSWTIGKEGERQEKSTARDIARLILPIIFGILMMISLSASSGYLLQAVATEKENRVVEVLLASAEPDEILFGKLLGLGAAGLIQMGVWFSMAVVGGLATAAMMSLAGIEIPWLAVGLGVVYFVLGYLVVGSLMIGTASLGNTMRESQQLSMVWTILTVAPMILLNALIAEPNGLAAHILSWIPFTAPLTMVLRLAMAPEGVAWWEIAGTLVLMLVSIWLAIKIGGRLFRVGVLLTGVRPKFRQILRQAGLVPGRS